MNRWKLKDFYELELVMFAVRTIASLTLSASGSVRAKVK
jgi:hypothetical protein